jgi:4-hydroxy-tetrahydrodipicolinate reductase
MTIRVLVSGSGNMGHEVLAAVCREDGLEAVGVVDLYADGDSISLPDSSGDVLLGSDPAALMERTRPDVAVDFTNAEWTPRLAETAHAAALRLVIGTSGLGDDFLRNLEQECEKRQLGAVVAPNFALGAVLMQQMAKTAARFYASAEIIELHHNQKVDAPSGTAIATGKAMAAARGKPFERAATMRENLPDTRGGEVDGITIHSVRLPGLVAHQEVILGSPGEILTIRHDTLGRESFMPGVLLAIRHVMEHPGLVVGLDRLIGLE